MVFREVDYLRPIALDNLLHHLRTGFSDNGPYYRRSERSECLFPHLRQGITNNERRLNMKDVPGQTGQRNEGTKPITSATIPGLA